MKVPLADDLLLIKGKSSFLLVGRAGHHFELYVETFRGEDVTHVDPDDLVVASCPEGGPILPAMMLLELVRRFHLPLVALPKNHPGSSRLRVLIAVSKRIRGSCQVQRGTHPEQHILCASEELSGIELVGEDGGVRIESLSPDAGLVHIEPFSGM
ncbi:MAG: alpha/beta hydrolase [Methanomicrobiales archaeon]|nr:alpha/beta hydrolase [Methanomicrobiales archaeon]